MLKPHVTATVSSVGKGTLLVRDSTSSKERFLTRRESGRVATPLELILLGHKMVRPHSVFFTGTLNPADTCSLFIVENRECAQFGRHPSAFVVTCCDISSVQVYYST